MPYVTSIERLGRQEGRQEGRLLALQENILEILAARFGEAPYAVREHIASLGDEAALKAQLRKAALAPSLGDFSENTPAS